MRIPGIWLAIFNYDLYQPAQDINNTHINVGDINNNGTPPSEIVTSAPVVLPQTSTEPVNNLLPATPTAKANSGLAPIPHHDSPSPLAARAMIDGHSILPEDRAARNRTLAGTPRTAPNGYENDN